MWLGVVLDFSGKISLVFRYRFLGQFFLEIRKVFLRGVEIFEFSFQGLEVFSIENFFFLLERYYDFLDQVIVLIVVQEFIFIY